MKFLVDHNLNGHCAVFLGTIASQGWLDLVPIEFVKFSEMNLPTDSDDRLVWRVAQDNQMILFTANRSMKGDDSLEQVMREENTLSSFPVVTIGNADRLLNDGEYRKRCVESLMAIVLDLETYLGVGRLFIP